MDYQVIYDVSQTSPEWWFPGVGFGLILIGVVVWHFRHRMLWAWHWPMRNSPTARTIFCAYWLGFSIVWTSFAMFAVVGGHDRAERALRDGRLSVVEGTVEDFHPMPYGGHDTERFTVNGIRFAYSDYEVGPGFNHTSSHGGPMRDGLHVRVRYLGRKILKLELAQSEPARGGPVGDVCR